DDGGYRGGTCLQPDVDAGERSEGNVPAQPVRAQEDHRPAVPAQSLSNGVEEVRLPDPRGTGQQKGPSVGQPREQLDVLVRRETRAGRFGLPTPHAVGADPGTGGTGDTQQGLHGPFTKDLDVQVPQVRV